MIVDSGPLVAALNRREASHQLAVSILQDAGTRARIPTEVLVEVDHLTRAHQPHDPPVQRIVDALSAGEHTLVAGDLELLEQAAVLDRRYSDLQLGITDCLVAVLSARYEEPIFTFDFRDFRAIDVVVGGRPLELVVHEGEVET